MGRCWRLSILLREDAVGSISNNGGSHVTDVFDRLDTHRRPENTDSSPCLPGPIPGAHTLTVTAKGFSPYEQTALQLLVNTPVQTVCKLNLAKPDWNPLRPLPAGTCKADAVRPYLMNFLP